MEAVSFNEEGGGPESGRTATTTEMTKKYYTKRTRMRLDQEQEKGHGNRQEYPAPDKEMGHEASELMPKPAAANRNNLLFPCTNKNDSYPFDYNYGGSGGFDHIRVGCLYELNHSPDQNSIPAQLKSVRVVMVISRTEINVTLRFPSVVSLHTHYSSTNAVVSDDRNKRIQYQHPQLMKKGKLRVHPELDEEYVMNLKLAGKLLIRKVLSTEFSKQKHLKSFWALTTQQPILASTPVQDHSGSDDYYVSDDDDDDGNCNEAQVGRIGLKRGTENYQSNLCRSWSSGGSSRYDNKLVMRKRGTCWSALTNNSDLHWGVRRRVAFMGPSKSNSNNDHHQDYRAEISNRFMRKSSRASEHQYYQHQSSLGIFEAVPEEEEEEQEQDEEEANANEMVEMMGMDQDHYIFRTNITTEDDDDDEEYHLSLERRRSLRSRNVDRSSKQLAVLLRNRKPSNNSKTPKKKIKPQCRRGLYNRKKEEEEDSDGGQNKLTRRATRSSAAASGLKIKIKKNNTTKKKKRRIKNTDQSNKDNQIVIHNKRQVVSVTSYDRWSKERYRKAEVSMLQIMKEKDAVSGKPVMRRVLRMEARKYIGDTGLLDHLLKHMSGKVAPDGEVRFRRRHNAEGEMEYWLENADLVNIRREAGVKDPYWTPPPGWMPGDNPSQDPLCAKDIKYLKQEMSSLKRNVEEIMCAHKQQQKKMSGESSELVIVPVNNLSSIDDTPLGEEDDSTQHQSVVPQLQASISPITTITTTPLVVDQPPQPRQNQLQNFHTLEEDYNNLMKKKAQLEQQLLDISNSLNGMQEEVWKFTSRVEDARTPTTIAGEEKSLTVVEDSNTRKRKASDEKGLDDQVWVTPERSDDREKLNEEKQKVVEKETKEEKRQRLRSGFRICKPQGSFLWPNMVAAASSPGNNNNNSNSSSSCSNRMMMLSPTATYNQSQVVPTPTSVSSSTTSKSDFLLLPPPQNQETHLTTPPPQVKPLLDVSSPVKKVMVTTIPSTSFSPPNNDFVNLGSPPAYHHHQSSSSLLWRDQSPMYLHQVGFNDVSPATNSQGLFCGTPTNSFYTNRSNTTRAAQAVRQHHQQQPRTLSLLPNVSCGRGNDDKHQEKDAVRIEQEAAAAVSFNSRNAASTTTTSDYDTPIRREAVIPQIYQRKQKQPHQQQQQQQQQQ
ncbi:hypothetical protein C5167_024184 [Papaver somniferum]|uniref:PTC1-like winged helix-turn-helix domain-containing protein n=1 Tax=Papaver somniferum TaxID=3469 RepID=A0A4Y7JQX9_PAPSO|nr:uncharacterized protein LOC113283156 [Papaver somniferum]RZC62432.1 hypothetical protein C5167_024184 [Papaver somniferum]